MPNRLHVVPQGQSTIFGFVFEDRSLGCRGERSTFETFSKECCQRAQPRTRQGAQAAPRPCWGGATVPMRPPRDTWDSPTCMQPPERQGQRTDNSIKSEFGGKKKSKTLRITKHGESTTEAQQAGEEEGCKQHRNLGEG